ncbi:hypothetical protein TOPH_07679 [Tolypocladium ophioglossoides CBS 100239]|uniref:Uncharacterized protein n=1 Tax=Tolypocladium ophioglossoides (strain CBS 100239) TaxID=1163406 RepID=A0A0L0N0X2_TOLOC|nr:hypothetical protein TOPH_07679 [Tolypocladium ophioglossoides CBS 100239]
MRSGRRADEAAVGAAGDVGEVVDGGVVVVSSRRPGSFVLRLIEPADLSHGRQSGPTCSSPVSAVMVTLPPVQRWLSLGEWHLAARYGLVEG